MSKKRRSGTDDLVLKHNIRSLKEYEGYSYRMLAKQAGCPSSVVFSWACGHVPHDLRAVAKLARTNGVSLKDMLFTIIDWSEL